jgi:hypothetical protein
MTTPETVVGLLAEPARLRVFSAVALGARTPTEVREAAGTSPKETAVALRRLTDGGMVLEEDGLRVAAPGFFRALTRAARPAQPADGGGGGDRTEALLRTFVRDGRLRAVPAQFERRRVVLRHLVHGSFRPGVTYTEKQVDATLKDWCEGSTTDHVTIRRYLIDLCLLSREDGGPYWVREDAL